MDYIILPTSLKKEEIDSLVYGTDGEMALEKAFEEVLTQNSQNIHLRCSCFTHVQQGMKKNLKELNVDEETKKKYCPDSPERIQGSGSDILA